VELDYAHRAGESSLNLAAGQRSLRQLFALPTGRLGVRIPPAEPLVDSHGAGSPAPGMQYTGGYGVDGVDGGRLAAAMKWKPLSTGTFSGVVALTPTVSRA
jgi:hypothetical protein